VRATARPFSGRSASLAALDTRPARSSPRLAHPDGADSRADASPSRFARRRPAGQLGRGLALRHTSSPRRTGASLRGPPHVLSRRARWRTPRSARRPSRPGLRAPATPWPRRAASRARSARVDSSTPGEPGLHRPTASGCRPPGPDRTPSRARSPAGEPAAGTNRHERSDRPRVLHDADNPTWGLPT